MRIKLEVVYNAGTQYSHKTPRIFAGLDIEDIERRVDKHFRSRLHNTRFVKTVGTPLNGEYHYLSKTLGSSRQHIRIVTSAAKEIKGVDQEELIVRLMLGKTKGDANGMFIDGDTLYSPDYNWPIMKRAGVEFWVNPLAQDGRYHQTRSFLERGDVGFLLVPRCDPGLILEWLKNCAKSTNRTILRARERTTEYAPLLDEYREHWRVLKKRFNLESPELEAMLYDEDVRSKIVLRTLAGGHKRR